MSEEFALKLAEEQIVVLRKSIAKLEAENKALIEWGKAIMAEANPLVLLHQARNLHNQTPLPRCAEAWKNLSESTQALLTAEEQE